MQYHVLKKALQEKSSEQRKLNSQRYFKTGKGQYGENDIFIGVTNPDIRSLAKMYADAPFSVISKLIRSPIHEERFLAIVLLVNQFKKAEQKEKTKIHQFYLRNLKFVNNWDLVDASASVLLGDYCLETKNHKEMDKLLHSKNHWSRRTAIIATFSFIRTGKTKLTFKYARELLKDEEDLMHKATGWALREAGKKDESSLKNFIHAHGNKMPRTMLRYAIERFSANERKAILRQTREKMIKLIEN
ncbi:MAG: DNA alkylation repair protein [Bacteriovorax sp.]